MFDFDGSAGSRSKVNLGGRGRNRERGAGDESRSDFVKRQHKEREAREKQRLRDRAAIRIQAVFRGHCLRKAQRSAHRKTFDKRYADIVKVGQILPTDKRAKFVFHALVPMLRQFAVFFRGGEDGERLSGMLELVLLSAAQQADCNILQLLLADDAQRWSVLVLLRKLLAAALQAGHVEKGLDLLRAFQVMLFDGPPSYEPVDRVKSVAAVAYILRQTFILSALVSIGLPQAMRAPPPTAAARTCELVLLCCDGLGDPSFTAVGLRKLLLHLLSAPSLAAFLCDTSRPLPSECLRRLSQLATAAAAPTASGALPGEGQAVVASHRLAVVIGEVPCVVSLLDNLVTVIEKFVLHEGNAQDLPAWLWLLYWCRAEQTAVQPNSGFTQVAVDQWARQLDRLHRASFVRAIAQGLQSRSGEDGLHAVCNLYFSPWEIGGSVNSEMPPEVMHTLAWSTSFTACLATSLAGLMEVQRVDEIVEALGPPALASPVATRLRVFCALYALQMQPMYDYEFFGPANPLKLDEVERLTLFLNRLAYKLVTTSPDTSGLPAAARAMRKSVSELVILLYNRHRRRPILRGAGPSGESPWVIPESKALLRRAPVVDLSAASSAETAVARQDSAMDVEEEQTAPEHFATVGEALEHSIAGRASLSASPERTLEAVLEEIPHVIPFEDRVALLHQVILKDQEARRDGRSPWGPMHRHRIRRDFLVEDGFKAFESLMDEASLRDVFRVEFIAPNGEPESGVDGGGLFKEFMVHICRSMFDPIFGLFSVTSHQTLYPSAGSFQVHGKATMELYTFLGKVVGKAIYEMFLLEPQFCRVFLNRLLGRTNEVDDMTALDDELHRNMLKIKESECVEDLGLTFSVSVSEFGHFEEVDLIPDGRNVRVTKDNLTRYVYRMANYKTNIQFQRHTAAFLRGLQCVVPFAWLKMFDPYELNTLISGSIAGFDVEDLRHNTVYSGGYQHDTPVIQWFWQLLMHHMSPEDLGRFLMFATSCSRAPLLGFSNLYPKFAVHRVPDSERLPTASTCANLLKLPNYASPEVLKVKVMQAIQAEAGFDLS